MNKGFIGIFLFISIAFFGCKKYGYTFKDGYTSGEDNSTAIGAAKESQGDNFSKLKEAAVFPGLVPTGEVRGDFSVTIDFSPKYIIPTDIKVFTTPQLWFSTGMYAAPGEEFTITVPAGVNGLAARVGGWTDYLRVDVLKRDPGISSIIQLAPGKNYVRSLYGGTIYIENYSKIQTLGTQTLAFSRVVKSPDFDIRTSSDAEWNERVRQSATPWFQLRGKRIVFDLPKKFLDKYPIPNPTALMQEWDRIVESDIYFWKGLEDVTNDSLNKAPETPIRVVMDIQLASNAYAHAAFPVMVTMDENNFLNITNLNVLKTKGAWHVMEANGLNYQTSAWMPSYLVYPTRNFYSIKMADRLNMNLALLNDSMKLAIDSGLYYVKKNLAAYTNNMNSNANFIKDIPGFKNYNLLKLLPFIQIFDNYGYDLYTMMDVESRHFTNTLNDVQKLDYIYTTISHARQIDFIPFFEMWGLKVSPAVAATIKQLYPRLPLDIYNYNPLLPGPMHGMTGKVPPPNRDVNRLNWGLLEYCCQELQAGYHPASLSFDYNPESYWRTEWFATQNLEPHTPHYMIIDMNAFNTIGGFWYQNPPLSDDGKFTPRRTIVYLDQTGGTVADGAYDWRQMLLLYGPNNNEVINSYDFSSTQRSRYLKVEIYYANPQDPYGQNSVSLAEFGVLGPKE